MSVEPRPGLEQAVACIGVLNVFAVVLVGRVDPVALVPSFALFEIREHQQREIGQGNRGQLLGRVIPQSHRTRLVVKVGR